MAADPAVARELGALRQELSAPRRKRPAPAAEAPSVAAADAPAAEAQAEAEEQQQAERAVAQQLHDFVGLIKEFIEEAEQNVAEHPAASVVGALFLGIMIGRLIGRR